MSWDFENNNGGNSKKAEFTTFPVGVTRIRVIDAEPNVRWTHWIQSAKRSINCPGKGCPICEIRKQQKASKEPYTYPMSRRFAINAYNLETEKVEILEQGITFFEDLKTLMQDLKEDNHTLNEAIIKVRRRGTTKDDTTYRLDVDSIDPLDAVAMSGLQEKKIELTEYFKPHTNEQILRIVQGEKWDDVMKSEQPATNENDEEVGIQ